MRRSSGEVPLLADGTALSFLVEEKARKKKEAQETRFPSSASSKRKRKKRSKRELPKSSSGVRIRSLFFFWCAVFPSVDDRPKMLDIMAGTEEQLCAPHVQGWFSWPFCTSRCVSFPVFRPEMTFVTVF